MSQKAVFLDRDGTIVWNKENPSNFHLARLFDYSAKAISLLKKAGFKVIIVSNQARIALGLVSEKQVKKTNAKMLKELKAKGAKVDALYYCPHLANDARVKPKRYRKECDCRKPKTGMLEKAGKRFKIDFSQSFVVGDDSRDILMGKNAGCKTVLVQTGHAGKDGHHSEKPDFVSKNLLDAAKIILKESISE